MELGVKLREARLAAGLSQKKLCEGIVTRNMLSQIENGSASPSMGTLQAFARRLGQPVSYFLGEAEQTSSNFGCLHTAWEHFERGDARTALEDLLRFRGPDPLCQREYVILRSLILLCLADQAIEQNRPTYARRLLQEAEELEDQHPWLPELKGRRIVLCGRLGDLIPESELPNVDSVLLQRARFHLDPSPARAAEILDAAVDSGNPQWCILRGKAAIRLRDYAHAAELLKKQEENAPEQVLPLLEEVYRELGDYKTAYYYACKVRDHR